jgi:hypothetical protein
VSKTTGKVLPIDARAADRSLLDVIPFKFGYRSKRPHARPLRVRDDRFQ